MCTSRQWCIKEVETTEALVTAFNYRKYLIRRAMVFDFHQISLGPIVHFLMIFKDNSVISFRSGVLIVLEELKLEAEVYLDRRRDR